MPLVREVSVKFSAPPEFSGSVLEKKLEHRQDKNLRPSDYKTRYSSTAPLHPYSEVSVAFIIRLSGRFLVTGRRIFRPYLFLLAGIFRPYL
jgi:hypothetical protein